MIHITIENTCFYIKIKRVRSDLIKIYVNQRSELTYSKYEPFNKFGVSIKKLSHYAGYKIL